MTTFPMRSDRQWDSLLISKDTAPQILNNEVALSLMVMRLLLRHPSELYSQFVIYSSMATKCHKIEGNGEKLREEHELVVHNGGRDDGHDDDAINDSGASGR